MYQSYWKDTKIKEVDEDAKISAKGITEKYTLAIASPLFILTYFFKCSQTIPGASPAFRLVARLADFDFHISCTHD